MPLRSRVLGWLKRKLGGKIPKAPKVSSPGHRGIAMGSRKRPDLAAYQERLEREHENIGIEEAEDFLAGGNMIFVHSSNVVGVQYHPATAQMMVEFKNGAAYLYDSISEAEAHSFVDAQSKGSWVWDHLRVRGSRTAHRKPYRKIK